MAARAGAPTKTAAARSTIRRFFPDTSRAIAAMWAGVVPQQPPRIDAPARMKSRATSRK